MLIPLTSKGATLEKNFLFEIELPTTLWKCTALFKNTLFGDSCVSILDSAVRFARVSYFIYYNMSLGEETVFVRKDSEGKEEMVMEWDMASQSGSGVYEEAKKKDSDSDSEGSMVFDEKPDSATDYESGTDAAPTETFSCFGSDEDDFHSQPSPPRKKKKVLRKKKSVSDIVAEVLESDEDDSSDSHQRRKAGFIQTREEWQAEQKKILDFLLAEGHQNRREGSRNSRSNFQKKVKRGGYTLVAGVLYKAPKRNPKGECL